MSEVRAGFALSRWRIGRTSDAMRSAALARVDPASIKRMSGKTFGSARRIQQLCRRPPLPITLPSRTTRDWMNAGDPSLAVAVGEAGHLPSHVSPFGSPGRQGFEQELL